MPCVPSSLTFPLSLSLSLVPLTHTACSPASYSSHHSYVLHVECAVRPARSLLFCFPLLFCRLLHVSPMQPVFHDHLRSRHRVCRHGLPHDMFPLPHCSLHWRSLTTALAFCRHGWFPLHLSSNTPTAKYRESCDSIITEWIEWGGQQNNQATRQVQART